jgi:hypothetical protein
MVCLCSEGIVGICRVFDQPECEVAEASILFVLPRGSAAGFWIKEKAIAYLNLPP